MTLEALVMSPENQRIAIAKACGWTKCRLTVRGSGAPERGPSPYGFPPDKNYEAALPDYLNDLNAAHKAEKVLQDRCKYWPDYIDELSKFFRTGFPDKDATNWSQMAHATAAQRAEAFLRAIGKWTEEK